MKIGYLSNCGIDQPRESSGTPYFLAKAIEDAFGEVVDISPKMHLYENKLVWLLHDPMLIVIRAFDRFFRSDKTPLSSRPRLTALWKEKIELILRENPVDVVYADKAAQLIPLLPVGLRVVYRSDITAALMSNYYKVVRKNFVDLSMNNERQSLDRASIFVPLSKWAANSAVMDFGQPQEKIRVIRSHSSLLSEAIATTPKAVNDQALTLLFIGADWERKGGWKVLDIVKILRNKGLNANLIVLSLSAPETVKSLPYVRYVEFLDRTTKTGSDAYLDLFRSAHYFILLPRAEAMGQVFVDALMTGLPSVTLDTGAVPEVVVNNKTGLLFHADSKPEQIAQRLIENWRDAIKYREMSSASIQFYEKEYSYAKWKSDMAEVFSTLIANDK